MDSLRQKKIAVVGVSQKEHKFAFKIFRDLLNAGFDAEGINPAGGQVAGKKIYRSLQELNFVPDLVITVVSPQVTECIVEECSRLGIKEIWMQPGSESEVALKKAKESGIATVHNACFMVKQHIW